MRSDLLHLWIQSAGILVASVWGIYTFVWQDILVPSWAPAAINLDLSLTPIEGRTTTADGSEMALNITATNPSSRKLYLLSNVWQLVGIHRKAVTEKEFIHLGNRTLRDVPLLQAERLIRNETSPTLAVGRIFGDDIIHPGEKIDRTIVVRLPAGYGVAEVNVVVPTLTKEPNQKLFKGRHLVWGLTSEDDVSALLCPSSDSAGKQLDGRNIDCQSAPELDLDGELRSFDPLMRVFSASEQVGIPISQKR
ncbi:hypothetical protein [Cyanobium sp. N5-Cardenillas]|uniref:hypothetical protein n=1 Tax=Cyanobium sp. N5-Cardenillas TaxID=2823720 RepID=UPI0020CD097E|nr:hypothetical protein [Cyanobium sp. N5-Cardenillas]MCP9787364.1 hypothetical protein [Cyanobium sp. N5-Cardenillas]